MEIGINDLDYSEEDNELLLQQQEPPIENGGEGDDEPPITTESPANGDDEEDAIIAYLKTKGIADPNKIKFENEDGDIEEVSWGDLSKEEQLNILNTSNSDPDRALDESEINFINEIRSGGMSVDEYKEMLISQGKQQAQNETIEPQYEVNNIPDDELYIADLKQKLGDEISDEELISALEAEKQNPELFAKKMKGLRQEYQLLEDQARNNEIAEQQRVLQEQFEAFQQNVLGEIQGLNKIGNMDVELDMDDMNDIANFILSNDPAGINYFAKALNDPTTLVKAAWFLTKGEQALNDISDYFTQLIKEVSKAQYKKGLEDGKLGKSSKSTAPRVIQTTQKQESNNTRIFKTIDDLD